MQTLVLRSLTLVDHPVVFINDWTRRGVSNWLSGGHSGCHKGVTPCSNGVRVTTFGAKSFVEKNYEYRNI